MNPHDSPMKENADRIQWADSGPDATSEKEMSKPDDCGIGRARLARASRPDTVGESEGDGDGRSKDAAKLYL